MKTLAEVFQKTVAKVGGKAKVQACLDAMHALPRGKGVQGFVRGCSGSIAASEQLVSFPMAGCVAMLVAEEIDAKNTKR